MSKSATLLIFLNLSLIPLIQSFPSSDQALNKNYSSDWNSYKHTHNKVYLNSFDENLRKEIFLLKKKEVERFNSEQANQEGFNLKLNHLSDWTETELNQLNGLKPIEDASSNSNSNDNNNNNNVEMNQILTKLLDSFGFKTNVQETIPDSVDWTKVPGRVSRVKDQGHCGSCWAFATTGVLEGRMGLMLEKKLIKDKKVMIELSEQELIDCSVTNKGCAGGDAFHALKDISRLGGINSEGFYPYEAKDNHCRFNKSRIVFGDTGAIKLPFADENKLKEIVAKLGPVAVSIDASSFRFRHYNAGIYYNRNCKSDRNELNHAVLIVGYSSDPVYGDYWIVKNSWSENWGEGGYIRMARNRKNHCGIATSAVIPTM